MATLLGVLHLNANSEGNPRGLTVAMPNTFAMSPGYVTRYVAKHRLRAPDVNPVTLLQARVERLWPSLDLPKRGVGWSQDALQTSSRLRRKAQLIFASPPYLEVIKYGKFNWIRLWMLGEDPRDVDRTLLTTSSLANYRVFMNQAMKSMGQQLSEEGWVALVIGDVRQRHGQVRLAEDVADNCTEGTGLHVSTILEDALPNEHKVSRIWGETRGRATKTDRILILSKSESRPLPLLPSIAWG